MILHRFFGYVHYIHYLFVFKVLFAAEIEHSSSLFGHTLHDGAYRRLQVSRFDLVFHRLPAFVLLPQLIFEPCFEMFQIVEGGVFGDTENI